MMDIKIEEIYQEELYIASKFFSRGYDMQDIKYLLEGNSLIEVLAHKIHRNITAFNKIIKNNNDIKILTDEKRTIAILNTKIENEIESCIIHKLKLAIKQLNCSEKKTSRKKEVMKQLEDNIKECQKIIREEEIIVLPKKQGTIYKILKHNYPKLMKKK